MWPRGAVILGVVLAGCASRVTAPRAAAPAPAPASLTLAPCALPGVGGAVRCGTHEVYEDRVAGQGRRISLRVAVLAATGPERAPDPLFFFAGGPGESAVDSAAGLAELLAGVRQRRDVVLVDQRGTGRSNGMQCEVGDANASVHALYALELSPAVFARCRDALAARADLRLYATHLAVDDIDEVRAALGYGRINLYGGSYGTRSALVYLARHPESVRSVVLRAVAPTDMKALLPSARHTQRALEGLFADCAADARCNAAYPELARRLGELLARLEQRPERVTVQLGGAGAAQVELTRPVVAGALQFLLAVPEGAAALPALITAAHAGDLRPFASATTPLAVGAMRHWSIGQALSVLCTEDAPRIRAGEVGPATAGTFLGAGRVTNQLALCREWPRGSVPEDYYAPVRAAAPVLMVSGELDPVDGLELAEGVAAALPNRVHVVIPRGTHNPQFPGCLADRLVDFLEHPEPRQLDVRCASQLGRALPP